jgi:hypothetical protein
MLTPYDDHPVHQLATTLDHAGTSDPRFFDRYWFIVYDEQGRVGLAVGVGVYKNTGVVDGFASAVVGGVQHNVRASRALRPDLTPSVGPLRIDVIEGLREFRLVGEESAHSPVSFDLTWRAQFAPYEEVHHFVRTGGIVVDDYRRFYQHGRATGSITVADTMLSGEFWSFRDRSFGVRPGMGGRMPTTAADAAVRDEAQIDSSGKAILTFGGGFSTEEFSATCLFAETADGSLLDVNGQLLRRQGGAPDPFTAVSHDLQFYPNGTVRGGEVRFTTASGANVPLTLGELMSPLAYVGFGYLDGWTDRLGLGAYRGPLLLEADSYDVSDVAKIRDLSGTRQFGMYTLLDQSFRIAVDGRPGFMEVVAGLRPGHQRYWLDVKGTDQS